MPPHNLPSRVALAALALIAAGAVALPPGATATAATTSPRLSSGTSSTTVTPPPSIDTSGAADVTADLNAFLAAAAPGMTVALPAGARYRVEGTLALNDKQDFVLDGNGAEIFATTPGLRTRSHLRLNGGTNVTVKELVVTGAHPNPGPDGAYVAALEAQHGIEVLGTERVFLRDNTVTAVYGDFLYLGRDQRSKAPSYRRSTSHVRVARNTFSGSGRQGVALTNASDVVIRKNDIGLVRRSMFDFEPNSMDGVVTDVLITENTLGDARLNAFASGGRGTVDNITVSSNKLVKQPMNAMIKAGQAVSRANWTFINNVSNHGFGSPLGGVIWAVGGVRNITFVGNTQPMNWNRKMAGVQSDLRSCGIVAHDNIMRYAVAQSRLGSQPCSE